MSNKYYITSNGSFRELHDDELAHAVTNGFGKKKTNHKYIDRKWSKGKWVYTYPDEKKTSGKSISDITKTNTASSKMTVNNTAKKASSEYEAELAYNSKKNVYPGSKTTGTTGTSSGGKSANNTSTTKKASSEYEAELAYNSKKNEYPSGQNNTSKTPEKKQSFGDKLKDILGVDERDKYRSTKNKYEAAKDKQDIADAAADAAREDWYRNGGDYTHDDHVDFRSTLSEASSWRKVVETRGREYIEAKSEYMKTPLGTFLKASEFISGIASDVGYTVEKTVDNARDAVKDVAFDVEYAVKRDTGISAKKEHDSAEYALRAAEDQLKKAKANHDSSGVYMAEFFLKQAEERYEKAKKAYDGTPMHSIESGLEWVRDLFDKKKRKKR